MSFVSRQQWMKTAITPEKTRLGQFDTELIRKADFVFAEGRERFLLAGADSPGRK